VEVLQREVETYENEIRALKDFKSPKRGPAGSRSTPTRRTPLQQNEASSNSRSGADDIHSTSALEATLFRPALQQALQEAARWKASATATAIASLPPLPALPFRNGNDASGSSIFAEDFVRLSSVVAECRLQKASIRLVNLTNRTKSPRVQLREIKARNAAATDRLETAVLRCRGRVQ
jgi:hypothetical protein